MNLRLMTGLNKICKALGKIKLGGTVWVWDYANNLAVKQGDMPEGSARWLASERVRWAAMRKATEKGEDNNETSRF